MLARMLNVPTYQTQYQISKDIGWVSQNTTLYYGVRCHRVDDMFRPFTIRPIIRSDMVKTKEENYNVTYCLYT